MPVRWAYFTVLAIGLLALAVAPDALAQNAGVDKVTFRDRNADGKIVTESGEVKETPKGVEIIAGGKSKTVFANDVLKVEPGALTGVNMAEVLAVRGLEEGKDPGKAFNDYASLVKKAGPAAPERTKRYLTFREAVFATRIADQKTGDDFNTEAVKAFDKLTAFTQLNRKSWEIWPASRTAARIQAELGDYPKAAGVLRSLANVADLPKELKYEAQLAEAGMLLRAGQRSAIEGMLSPLEQDKDFPIGPLKERLGVLRAASKIPAPAAAGTSPPADLVAKLQDAIDQAKDPVAKAIGYSFLGEAQLAYGQTREAMWSFLWVDVVFNQDKDEQILAVRRLVTIFDKQGDKDRADQFRDKLPRIR